MQSCTIIGLAYNSCALGQQFKQLHAAI